MFTIDCVVLYDLKNAVSVIITIITIYYSEISDFDSLFMDYIDSEVPG